jgi:probable F420-dependent oxidoreductase
MRIGLTIFLTDESIGAVEMARETEARGFSSLWFPEHTHIPTSRRTPFPSPDGELPAEYYRVLDPVVALTACAVATEHLVLGSGISLVAQHDPIAYAKSWATLDLISGGRSRFGVGFGWNVEEMHEHGVPYATRREHAREHVLAMHRLWSHEEASFIGEHVSFEPTFSWPKPLQQPRIPTYVGGGGGPKLFRHVAEYADGWLPIGGAGIRESLPKLHEAWAAAGRSGAPDVVPFGTVPSASKLDYYESLGCTEVVLRVPSFPRDEALRVLDEFAPFVGR